MDEDTQRRFQEMSEQPDAPDDEDFWEEMNMVGPDVDDLPDDDEFDAAAHRLLHAIKETAPEQYPGAVAAYEASKGMDDPRTVPVLTPKPNVYEEIYENFVAAHGTEALRPQSVGDTIRTAFFSALTMTQNPAVMMALMIGGQDFAKGLAAWWADKYLSGGLEYAEGMSRTAIVGSRTDDEGHISFGEVTIDDIVQFGHDHFQPILSKEE